MDRQVSEVINLCRDINSEKGAERRVGGLEFFVLFFLKWLGSH